MIFWLTKRTVLIGKFFSDIAQILAEKDVKKIFSLTFFVISKKIIAEEKLPATKKAPVITSEKLTFTGVLFPFHPFILSHAFHIQIIITFVKKLRQLPVRNHMAVVVVGKTTRKHVVWDISIVVDLKMISHQNFRCKHQQLRLGILDAKLGILTIFSTF